MKTFFSSDHHFNHNSILIYQQNRGELFTTINEHDDFLIKSWNSVVGKNDIVYHLGDIFFCGIIKAKEISDQLNGKIHLILGNHCKIKMLSKLNRFESIQDYKVVYVEDEDTFKKRQKIILCHYPFESWWHMSKGSIMLHGHSHGSLEHKIAKRMDVGVDTNNFIPYEYNEIKEKMKEEIFVPVDGHK